MRGDEGRRDRLAAGCAVKPAGAAERAADGIGGVLSRAGPAVGRLESCPCLTTVG